MKLLHILTASALILALASCTSEVEEAISGQKVPLQITASIERDSRAAGVEDTEFKEGESIQFAGNYEEDPYIATFTGKDWIFERDMILDNNDRTIQAMYPVGGEFLLEPGLWEQIMVRFKAGTNILLSYPDVVNNSQPIAKLRFRHLMSRVHFSVTNPEAKKLTSITLSGENIYQDAIFISDANLNYYVFDDFHTGEIIIKNENATAIEVQDFDALLVPHSQGDATLTLNYEGGKTYTTTITLPELKMGDYYRVPITISGGEVTPEPIGKDVETFEVNGVKFNMIKVEAGTFEMGKSADGDDWNPVHAVMLTKDYYIGETEVTQALWKAVMGYSPTSDGSNWTSLYGLGDNYPAYYISYEDVLSFITKLNEKTGQKFRMPTEAEWEYAAKGGKKSQGYTYSGSNTIGDVAWYNMNSYEMGVSSPDYGTHVVKTKQPNEFGLYDMTGNVAEWCSDWNGSYSRSPVTDPTGPESGSDRVLRGGNWGAGSKLCSAVNRNYGTPTVRFYCFGFRLALSPSE